MSTYLPKPFEIQRSWHVVDASGMVLGRLASKVAVVLQGKNKPTYAPNVDTGDFVIIINADKITVTGKKADQIVYDTYSKHPGGRRVYAFKDMLARHPERVVELAVKRMLPKNRIGKDFLHKLKIYKGDKHEHAAQQPKELKFS